jgi:predicted nucleic acid-binding protein
MILCDTNILIEFYRGNPVILDVLHDVGVPNLAISIITAGELFYGAQDKRELKKIQKHLALINQISLDTEISARFVTLLENYALSHKLSVPDALIGATAICHNLPLYTLNRKDFRFIPEIQFFKP